MVKVLDCTLRDGGYCNNWRFGKKNITAMIKALTRSKIDIIECGFLTELHNYCSQTTLFTDPSQVAKLLPDRREGTLYVVMMNCGEYNANHLPPRTEHGMDGIRVAFHKKDLEQAVELCRTIKKKGYLVFMQPMVTQTYTDLEFVWLIEQCNAIDPYAFYIVDSFGGMKKHTLIHLFAMANERLHKDILLGFHSHNNMQLSFSHAQQLVEMQSGRPLILDASVFGMGRGAGNLNTELLIQYLNETVSDCDYQAHPLFLIMDQILSVFYVRNRWGYSLPNYLSAVHDTHPFYAEYLAEKNTLTITEMDELFGRMDGSRRVSFDPGYMEQLYVQYMTDTPVQRTSLDGLQQALKGKTVLVIGPGKSVREESERIAAYAAANNVVRISLGFVNSHLDTDYIFLSNLKRYWQMGSSLENRRLIVTSNIVAHVAVKDIFAQVEYSSLINDVDAVRDNSAMMLLRLLVQLNVQKIVLAGIDGYSCGMDENYADQEWELPVSWRTLEAINRGMCRMLEKFRREIPIEFLTEPRYVH